MSKTPTSLTMLLPLSAYDLTSWRVMHEPSCKCLPLVTVTVLVLVTVTIKEILIVTKHQLKKFLYASYSHCCCLVCKKLKQLIFVLVHSHGTLSSHRKKQQSRSFPAQTSPRSPQHTHPTQKINSDYRFQLFHYIRYK